MEYFLTLTGVDTQCKERGICVQRILFVQMLIYKEIRVCCENSRGEPSWSSVRASERSWSAAAGHD